MAAPRGLSQIACGALVSQLTRPRVPPPRNPAQRLSQGCRAGSRLPLGEWDLSTRHYQAAHPGAPLHAVIHDETGIVPSAVAQAACEEAGRWLGVPLPREWITELAEHAEVVYQHNPRFRRLLRRPANAGRDWLQAFTRHWLRAMLASRRPNLLARLPPSYAIGRNPTETPLCPPPPHPSFA